MWKPIIALVMISSSSASTEDVSVDKLFVEGVDYTLWDDQQIPIQDGLRSVRGLGGASYTDPTWLWPGGRVNWVIDTSSTGGTSAPLANDDTRVLQAIAHWQSNTCVRFTRHTGPVSNCPKPCMKFVKHASACNSPVGLTFEKVNQINLAAACGLGATIHEVGHSMGLSHEQSRNDRDEHVYVNMNQVEVAQRHNFDKNGATGRDIGAYDYGSIMHYGPDGFAIGNLPTIVSSVPIGQRHHLSEGDIATIDFMYNSCTDVFTVPRCIVSQETTMTHTIPHSKAWRVEFNAVYSETMTLDFSATTATMSDISLSKNSGASVGTSGNVVFDFTPRSSDAGQTFTLATKFVGSDAKESTCTVDVMIANTANVCFGVASDDASVCSGRGTCVDDPLTPCQCQGSYGGLECLGFTDCPENYLHEFDDDIGTWGGTDAALDNTFFASGSASFKVGDAASNGQASISLLSYSKPRRISFFISPFDGSSPTTSFRDGNTDCFELRTNGGSYSVSSQTGSTTAISGVFNHIDLHVNWGSQLVDLYIDGHLEFEGAPFRSSCTRGINKVIMFGNAWWDEFHLWCTSYILMTGSVVEGLTQDKLRAGGTTMTLTLVGDYDEWIDTTANKQAIIDAMIADYPTQFGWNNLRNDLLNPSLLTVDSSDKQILRIGPLVAASTFSSDATELVDLYFKGSMFKSGKQPLWSVKDVEFQIPGICHHSLNLGLDDSSWGPDQYFTQDTSRKFKGAGSMKFAIPNYVKTFAAGGIQGTVLTYAVYLSSGNEQVNIDIVAGTDIIPVNIGYNGDAAFNSVTCRANANIRTNGWTEVEVTINWTTNTMNLKVGGQPACSDASFGGSPIDSLTLSAGGVANIDEISLTCEHRDPVFTPKPTCPKPGIDAPIFHFYPGTDKLGASDKAAVVPNTVTDCSQAEAQCQTLGACSDDHGVIKKVGVATEWYADTLSGLSGNTEYKICYKPTSLNQWVLTGSFTTCGGATTDTPTAVPTMTPTIVPTMTPTIVPTMTPAIVPTITLAIVPTMTPAIVPTMTATIVPTMTPAIVPTMSPAIVPTMSPAIVPTMTATIVPTMTPAIVPTMTPAIVPTMTPAIVPTMTATIVPTMTPAIVPTMTLAIVPTMTPTIVPTDVPAFVPTAVPTSLPVGVTASLTTVPTSRPTTPLPAGETYGPTAVPTAVPTKAPGTPEPRPEDWVPNDLTPQERLASGLLTPQQDDDDDAFPWWIIAVAAGVLLLCGAIAGFIVYKKKESEQISLSKFSEYIGESMQEQYDAPHDIERAIV